MNGTLIKILLIGGSQDGIRITTNNPPPQCLYFQKLRSCGPFEHLSHEVRLDAEFMKEIETYPIRLFRDHGKEYWIGEYERNRTSIIEALIDRYPQPFKG